jgi:hypothetical protein
MCVCKNKSPLKGCVSKDNKSFLTLFYSENCNPTYCSDESPDCKTYNIIRSINGKECLVPSGGIQSFYVINEDVPASNNAFNLYLNEQDAINNAGDKEVWTIRVKMV